MNYELNMKCMLENRKVCQKSENYNFILILLIFILILKSNLVQ